MSPSSRPSGAEKHEYSPKATIWHSNPSGFRTPSQLVGPVPWVWVIGSASGKSKVREVERWRRQKHYPALACLGSVVPRRTETLGIVTGENVAEGREG
jgi:hypothetical protein